VLSTVTEKTSYYDYQYMYFAKWREFKFGMQVQFAPGQAVVFSLEYVNSIYTNRSQ